ncbi:hypothetical protein I5L43_03470 [Serratia marcescens]|nr:hypothetical protein [Serratia marcescens]MBH2886201.1 hypothetical protein [Serratia marcescens]
MFDIKVNIVGDFIESYIYSGVLFTVDTNGVLCSYSWDHLIRRYLSLYPEYAKFKNKLLDSRKNNASLLNEDITITIDKNFLNKNQKGTCTGLDVWCTDLDVKDNILYIASEKGVETIPFVEEWNNGVVQNFVEPDTVWSGAKVFGLSTGSWGRTILAAGTSGAIEIVNNKVSQVKQIGLSKKVEREIDNNIILDCEWDSFSTLAILDGIDKKIAYKFNNIGSDGFLKGNVKAYEGFIKLSDKEKRDKINKIIKALEYENGETVSLDNFSHSWFENNILHAIDHNNNIYALKRGGWVESNKEDFFDEFLVVKLKNISAGSFVETEDDEIYRLINGKKYPLPEGFTSWRVFPRSKNYQDRIHIVYDDFLQIRIFDC